MAQGDGGQVDWLDGLVELVRGLHERIIATSGGMHGEHTASLYAACARPYQSAFGEFIYATPFERAAALMHAVICDHVFVDGNKRTGTMSALVLLAANNIYGDKGEPSELQVRILGDVALDAASSGLTVEQVTDWIRRIFGPLPGET